LKEVVKTAVAEAVAQVQKPADPTPVEKQEETPAPQDEKITKSDIQSMIDEAIRKAVTEGVDIPEEEPEEETMDDKVAKAVAKAMEPYLKQEGLPTNLNNMDGIQKSEDEHYLHGII